jgi:hypothetical protein
LRALLFSIILEGQGARIFTVVLNKKNHDNYFVF